MKGLSPRQSRFAQEYLVDQNGTQAAIRAGYSTKGADVQAIRLLGNARVAALITQSRQKTATRLEIKADDVLLENLRLARSDLRMAFKDGSLLPPDQWPDELASAISSVKVVTKQLGEGEVKYVAEIKLWDKGAAIDRTFKHLGLYEKDNSQAKLGLISDSTLDRLINALGGER